MSDNRTGARVIIGLIALVFLFPASIVFLFGLLFWGDELDKTARTTGTIAAPPRLEGPGDPGFDPGEGQTACRMDIEFVVDGRTFVAESDSSVGNCDRRVGERVEVHYDPSDPYEHTVGSRTTNQVIGIVMMGAAGVWTLVVLAFTWGIFRLIKRRPEPIPAWGPGRDVAHGQVPLGAYETYDGGSAPRRTGPDLSAYGAPPPSAPPPPAPSTPPPPVSPPPASSYDPPPAARVWDPADTDERPDRAGWYPTGDGSLDRWYNGLSWSDATRPRGGDPQ